MERLNFDAIILKPNDNVGTSIKTLKKNTEIILKLEEQWFDGKEDGLFREWGEEGQLLKALRYKQGELIEVLKN